MENAVKQRICGEKVKFQATLVEVKMIRGPNSMGVQGKLSTGHFVSVSPFVGMNKQVHRVYGENDFAENFEQLVNFAITSKFIFDFEFFVVEDEDYRHKLVRVEFAKP